MKKMLSLMLAVAMTATAMAQDADHTMLKLRLSDRSPIAVNLDGRYIDRQTTTLVLDGYVAAHLVEVYSSNGYRFRPVRIYTGTIRLEPGTVNIAMIDVYRRILRMRIRPMEAQSDRAYADNEGGRSLDSNNEGGYNDRNAPHEYPQNDRDNGKDNDVYSNNDNHNDRNDSEGSSKEEGYGSFPRGRNNADRGNNTTNILTKRDVNDLRTRTDKRITDSDKESLMKSELASRTMYTHQVREMMRWLSFESSRLDFAKWAYSRIADQQNYSKLEDVFDFSASRKEFNDAIRGR